MERSDKGNGRRKPMLDITETILLILWFATFCFSVVDYGMKKNAGMEEKLDG